MTVVDVITPTIEGREELLAEAAASVQAQTTPARHMIICDVYRAGPAVLRNAALNRSRAEHVAFLDDDDLLDPDHIEALLELMDDTSADVAFSWHRTIGGLAPIVDRFEAWCDEALATMLMGRNIIPVTVLAKRSAVLRAGGFNPADRYEDYSLWLRMIDQHCRFVCLPRETWTYRFLGGNRTWA